jgi:hypothetical protein
MLVRGRSLRAKLSLVAALSSAILFANAAYADQFSWTRSTSMPPGQYWSAVTSNDGAIIIASARSTFITRSTNGGSTWTNAAGTASGAYFLVMSSDGSKVFAYGNEGGYNYTSTDSGATWVARTTGVTGHFQGRPCMSEDGQSLMVTQWGGIPRVSSNGGATWANASGLSSAFWYTCAMSDSGTYRYAVNNGSTLSRSTDSGATWQSVTLPQSSWNDVATSGDGSTVYISNSSTGRIYKSSDFGATFSWINNGVTITNPRFIATSADASIILAFTSDSTIKVSKDGGSSWTTESTPGSKNWFAGDISANGLKVVAPIATNDEYIYRSSFIAPSTISLSSGGTPNLIFRTPSSFAATSNYPGKVTFYANGKKIAGCVSKTTISLVATCSFKPTNHGAVTVTARFVPTDSAYASLTVELFRSKVAPRSILR